MLFKQQEKRRSLRPASTRKGRSLRLVSSPELLHELLILPGTPQELPDALQNLLDAPKCLYTVKSINRPRIRVSRLRRASTGSGPTAPSRQALSSSSITPCSITSTNSPASSSALQRPNSCAVLSILACTALSPSPVKPRPRSHG